jgi:hypothetical protein
MPFRASIGVSLVLALDVEGSPPLAITIVVCWSSPIEATLEPPVVVPLATPKFEDLMKMPL